MKKEVEWITDALSSKNIAREMTHYRVLDGEIGATDGRLIAGHPFPHNGPFLVPGAEFEKLLKRMPADPTIEVQQDCIVLKAGRSRGTIQTLPVTEWVFKGVEHDDWAPAPEGLVDTLRDLRPFVSDNATQTWAMGICLNNGYAYATNNVVLAGVRCEQLGNIEAILPLWAIDFIIDREEGLTDWQWTEDYVAFRWESGAWMRATIIADKFHEQAARMIKSAEQAMPSTAITKEFRESLTRAVGLSDGVITIDGKQMQWTFGAARLEETHEGDVFASLNESTLWSAKHLASVVACATHWEPGNWPKPCVFKGERVFGYLAARRS